MGLQLQRDILPCDNDHVAVLAVELLLLLQAFLRHKNVLITPALLHKEGIPFVKVGAVHSVTQGSLVV